MINTDLFNIAELTRAINAMPVQFGLLNASGLFPDRGIVGNTAVIETRTPTLGVLPTNPWGAAGSVANVAGRSAVSVIVPQVVHDVRVAVADLYGRRAFGSTGMVESINTEVARRLQEMRKRHEVTQEFRKAKALTGVVVDKDGSTILDINTTLGFTQAQVDFALGTSTTDILGKCAQVKNYIFDNLGDDVSTAPPAVWVPADFYGAFINHAKVTAAYSNYTAAADRLGGDMRDGFTFGGLVFKEYRATFGGSSPFAAKTGYAVPVGTTNTFDNLLASADYAEAYDAVGVPFYAKQWMTEDGRAMLIQTQSNHLPIYARNVVVKVYSSN